MMDNEYVLTQYSEALLADARAAAARHALADGAPVLRPCLAALVRRARARYARWSSAASIGSKPTTSRACVRSR